MCLQLVLLISPFRPRKKARTQDTPIELSDGDDSCVLIKNLTMPMPELLYSDIQDSMAAVSHTPHGYYRKRVDRCVPYVSILLEHLITCNIETPLMKMSRKFSTSARYVILGIF